MAEAEVIEATEVENCREVLKIYSDGSIVRSPPPGFPVPYADDGRVEWKDLVYDKTLGLELRLYIPTETLASQSEVPIFVYFHGGGYCIGSRTWGNLHNYCLRLALALSALVIAPDYRLGPENRLPASLDDGYAAIKWIRTQKDSMADPWMEKHADFSRVYISGESAGGGIAYHVSIRAPFESSWGRVQIKVYILFMPFFGGEDRTQSEATCPPDAYLNRDLTDRYWRLSLPFGANRDCSYSNPFAPGGANLKELELPAVLVIVGGRDIVRDRDIEYAEMLEEYGKQVELVVYEAEQHGFVTLTTDSPTSKDLMDRIFAFMEAHR